MSDDSWHLARLIPTSGIEDVAEQERRATSALLAVMGAVAEFARAVTGPLGAPHGVVETFVAMPFTLVGREFQPDGVIRIRRGQRVWTALVAVRTGGNRLGAAKLQAYLDIAQEHRFAAVLTVSNEIRASVGLHPVVVNQRRLRAVSLHHHSWSQLLAEASAQQERLGGTDPDQAWLLGELIRYLRHPRSGALEQPMNVENDVNLETSMSESRSIDVNRIPASRSVSLEPEATVRQPTAAEPPIHPSRREVRLARQLEFGDGDPADAPEAGWYQDPSDDGQLRWFDGSAWSQRTYPLQPALA